MKPTWQEFSAFVFVMGITVSIVALKVLGEKVDPELYAAFALGVGYIFGSRTSQPGGS